MSDNGLQVIVTTHALDRWRQRAAAYGDADGSEVVTAVRESKLVTKDDPLPCVRKDGMDYRLYPSGCYFITQPLGGPRCRVITMWFPEWVKPPAPEGVTVKKKAPAVAATSLPVPEVVLSEPPPFADVTEERSWWQVRRAEVQEALSGLTGSDLSRPAWLKALFESEARLREIRPAYQAHMNRLYAGSEPVRSDGTYNYQAMMKLLLGRIEVLEDTVKELRSLLPEKKE